jgi:hypothetical protein
MNQIGSITRCRICGGMISSTSTVCRHCGSMIRPVISRNKNVHPRKRLPFGDFLISIIFSSLTILFLTAVTLIVMPAHPTRASEAVPPSSPVAVSPATIVISAPKENLTYVHPEIAIPSVENSAAALPGVAGSGVVVTGTTQSGVAGSGGVDSGVVEPPVYGQGGTCISGTIIDIYEQPVTVDNWIITIANSATPGTVLDSVIADLSGAFNFPTDGHPALSAGTYTVTLQVPEG